MISVRFQGKPFNITVIQVYALTSNCEEAEVERYYEDLQDLLELTPIKDVNVHSCHLLFDHFQVALIHGPNIPGSYAILLFTASDLASITRHIHSWVLFLLWLHPFILSGVISPLISSSILGTY